jgi:hypothetical protein
MNTNHVIDSWIAELKLAPRRLRRRENERAAARPAGAGQRRLQRGPFPPIPAVAIEAAGER